MKYKLTLLALLALTSLWGQDERSTFTYLDVFELEYASDPQIDPSGSKVVYLRNRSDILTDKTQRRLWLKDLNTGAHYQLLEGEENISMPRWSPDGKRLAYLKATELGSEIYIYWTSSGTSGRISQLDKSPSSLTWSADGSTLYFSMKVEEKAPVLVQLPAKPKGAQWAEPARITNRLKHEADGQGYLTPGYTQLFAITAEGGTPRQLTSGAFQNNGGLSPDPQNRYLYFSSNRNEDWEYQFNNSEIYRLDLQTLKTEAMTDRNGPDSNPLVSPDGRYLAYLGYEDKVQAYQRTRLYLLDLQTGSTRELLQSLDRDVEQVRWDAQGKGLYFSYDEFGDTKIAYVSLKGDHKVLASQMGGTTLGRPYTSGSYSISAQGDLVYTQTTPERPSDLVYIGKGSKTPEKLTHLNEDLLGQKQLGKVEEVWYTSSVDGRKLQGWIVKPPFYEEGKTYPLLVENHGGPVANYGNRFSAEMQLYAAHGYLVFYPNPRGSTSYGEEFGNELYHNYPGDDYQDVMDGVDLLISRKLTSEDQLFVTGGSAGGIMTTWMIGKNERFEAAVVVKPVINWISKTLVADNYYGYAHYRLPGQPWEEFETYWKYSPLSLVGNISTPTMVMVGMDDLRTPPSEAKQLYHALKLRKIETVLVEIPSASHDIANRPSNMITKVAHTLAWFDRYLKKS